MLRDLGQNAYGYEGEDGGSAAEGQNYEEERNQHSRRSPFQGMAGQYAD